MDDSERKKRLRRASWRRGKKTSPGLPLEIENDTLEIGFVEDLFLLRGAQEESATANIVDLAGHPLGVIVDTADETVAKDLILAASDAEVVLDVTGGLFEVKGAEMITDGNALVESLVGGEAQLVGQVGLTEKNEREQGSGIHLVVEQETELVKDVCG